VLHPKSLGYFWSCQDNISTGAFSELANTSSWELEKLIARLVHQNDEDTPSHTIFLSMLPRKLVQERVSVSSRCGVSIQRNRVPLMKSIRFLPSWILVTLISPPLKTVHQN